MPRKGDTSPDKPPRKQIPSDRGMLSEAEALSRPLARKESGRKPGQEHKKKVYFLKKFLEKGARPQHPEDSALLVNTFQIGLNAAAFDEKQDERYGVVHDHLFSPQPPDQFDIQNASEAFTSLLLQDTENLDMVDLLSAVRVSENVVGPLVNESEPKSSQVVDRLIAVRTHALREFVEAVAPENLRGEAELDLTDTYRALFIGDEAGLNVIEKSDLRTITAAVRDRNILADLVVEGGLWQGVDAHGESSYSRPAREHELEKLNSAAADTIERLHLLKAYGVISFEVPAEKVRLPWDIAVVPPITVSRDGAQSSTYAEGAIADFLLLPKDETREHILFKSEQDPNDKNLTKLTVGDSHAQMRFRLHDNGQISHGLMYTNTPSDLTEKSFEDVYAGEAFQRLRGLFIALACDAIVRDDVVSERQVGGSVASTFRERPDDPAGKRITDLLLRRRKLLWTAGVSERNPHPESWPKPLQDVSGYIKKLPEGTRARPTAEEEARAYYEGLNLPFNGLPEGYTFANPYKRGSEAAGVVYRKARFRKSSSTAGFLKSI